MKSKWILIIGLEFLSLLYLLNLLDLLDLKTGITLGLVEIGIAILAWWLNEQSETKRINREEKIKQREKLEQETNKKCEELKGYIHEHNQKLIDTVIKHWYTITPHDITCRMKAIDTVIKPWYEDKFVIKNEFFTTEHLQSGFADIWKLRQECKTLIDDLSSEENAIKEYIKGKLEDGIPVNFEQDFSFVNDGVLIGDFTLDKVENLIYATVEKFSNEGGVPDNYKLHPQYFGSFGINIVIDKNKIDLVEKMENFGNLVEIIIKDKTLYDKFETTNKTRKLSHKKIKEFYHGLKQIEHDFGDRHIELKGTCKDCKDWHDKLESLK